MVKDKIQTFNQHVKVNVEGLKARGDRTYDLITNLFKAYHVASDTELFYYIKTNSYRYYDVEYIAPEQITIATINNYEVILASGKWNTMSQEQNKNSGPRNSVR